MKFADILETSEGLKQKSLKVVHDEELDKAELLIFRAVAEPLFAWFIQQHLALQFLVPQTICKSLVSRLIFNQFCSSLIFIFLIIRTLDYPDYFI